MKTTTLWGYVGNAGMPTALRGGFTSEGGFVVLGEVVDFGGDPASWTFVTGDHVTNVAGKNNLKRIGETISYARLMECVSTHAWKASARDDNFSLAKWLENAEHPLNKTAPTIETIRKFYSEHRSEPDQQ